MADDETDALATARAIEDDHPRAMGANSDPEIAAPLAPFKGGVPPTPQWFTDAIAVAPERSLVPVRGANIELLTWGQLGNPGLIFVHGNSAHADWWSFIAPFFAEHYRVAAFSLSGMGGSDWREAYDFDTFAEEIWACAKAAGLYEAPVKPIYIGHSFGGAQVFYSGINHPERMRACLLVDTGFGGPPSDEEIAKWVEQERAAGRDPGQWRAPPRNRANKVYPTLEAALARFRFMPPQKPGHLFITDYIARKALKRAPMADGSGEGWTWCFDPGIWGKLDRDSMQTVVGATPKIPMAHIYGANSDIIFRRGPGRNGLDVLPPEATRIVIPESAHHIMVDQPLALVSAMRALLTVWPT